MVVTICGSMKFSDLMKEIASLLEINNGWCVLQCVYLTDISDVSDQQLQKLKESHIKRIDLSDAIFVVNKNGYIGNSTKNEIEYATKMGKQILYLEN